MEENFVPDNPLNAGEASNPRPTTPHPSTPPDPPPPQPQPTPPPATPPPVTAYCRACGKGLTRDEVRTYGDTIYCAEHLPGQARSSSFSSSPYSGTAPQSSSTIPGSASPGLAFMLGLIPGVGAIYNGQFAKAVVHLLITALVFNMADHESGMQPLFGMLTPVWIFYMALEAYHTAKKKQMGEPMDEFSSIFPARGASLGFPLLPVLLIALGLLFLLDNLRLLSIQQLVPYAGPLFLILLGAYMLYARLRPGANGANSGEVSHERN